MTTRLNCLMSALALITVIAGCEPGTAQDSAVPKYWEKMGGERHTALNEACPNKHQYKEYPAEDQKQRLWSLSPKDFDALLAHCKRDEANWPPVPAAAPPVQTATPAPDAPAPAPPAQAATPAPAAQPATQGKEVAANAARDACRQPSIWVDGVGCFGAIISVR